MSNSKCPEHEAELSVVAKINRAVNSYRREHGEYPARIFLNSEDSKRFSDEMVQREVNLFGVQLRDFDKPAADEKFLDGMPAYFKGIPVLAEIDDENELIVE